MINNKDKAFSKIIKDLSTNEKNEFFLFVLTWNIIIHKILKNI